MTMPFLNISALPNSALLGLISGQESPILMGRCLVRLNQSVVQSETVGSSWCAVSVPCTSIPCALKRFFSIPELIASVRA
jgi:hypothetical protein